MIKLLHRETKHVPKTWRCETMRNYDAIVIGQTKNVNEVLLELGEGLL